MAILLSNALVFASVSTSALSAPLMRNGEPTDVVRTTVPNNNQSPLPPGTAAGIKQAQGYEVSPALAIGIVAGLFIIGVLLIGDNEDDHNAPSTTGTH